MTVLIPKRHGRLGAPKTSTGCKTCKKRRVKCDETKPSCLRCKKAGRDCLGYEPWQVATSRDCRQNSESSIDTTLERSIIQIHRNEDEHRFFQFFVSSASRQIAGILGDDFWIELVPQMSFSDSAVRHCVIAVSSMFRQHSQQQLLDNSPRSTTSSEQEDSFALSYYNKALKTTMTGMSGTKDIQTALVTCILFFCIESLQSHDVEALKLYRQGQVLLDRTINRRDNPLADATASSVFIDHRISPIFARLRVLASLFGEGKDDNDDVSEALSPTEPQSFSSTKEARTALFNLTMDIHQFIIRATRHKWPPFNTPEMIEALTTEQLKLAADLHTWRIRFSNSIPNFGPPRHPLDNSTHIASIMMRCHRLIVSVWMSCALSPSECSYDRHVNSFRTVLVFTSEVVDLTLQHNDGVPIAFQFELGVIPPLYMTARKCRDPYIRRWAVDLLRRAPRQEGLWESEQMAVVSEKIIEIEERGLEPGEWPPEEARVHDCVNELHSANTDGIWGHQATFTRKPWGLSGDWEVWQEWFEK